MSQQIIEWSIDGIRILTADASGRVSQAGFWSSFEHHDTSFTPLELGEKLRRWIDTERITTGPATLLLPREMVVVRQLQLPQAPENELPDLVKFQAAAKSSLPIDEQSLDYLPLSTADPTSSQAVLTTSIDRRRLQRIVQILSAAGFEIQHATITPLAVGQFSRQFAGATLGTVQPEMMIFQRGSLIELSIFSCGSLVFSHSMVLPEQNRLKPLESGISRSLVALNQTQANVKVNRCFVIGSASDADVRGLLENKFPNQLVEVSLPGSLSAAVPVEGFETLIGAALPVTNLNLKLDLLHPRKRVEKPDRKKWYWIGGGVAAALLFMLSYGVFLSKKSSLEASIEALNESIGETDRKLKVGAPQLDAFQRVESWSLGQSNPIAIWNRLRNHMPGTDRLYLSELRLQPVSTEEVEARFTGVGFARLRNDVDNLYQQLAENGFRVTPQATSNTSRDPDYPVRFELNVDVLRDKVPPLEPPKSVAAEKDDPASPQS